MTAAEFWKVDVSQSDVIIVRMLANEREQWFEASEQLWQLITPALNTRSGVILDLTEWDYMGSCVLSEVVRLWKRLRVNDKQVVLCGLSPAVRDTFRCPGPSPFTIVETVQDAIRVLRELADR